MIIDTINSQREVTAEEAVQWKFYTPNENFMHHQSKELTPNQFT